MCSNCSKVGICTSAKRKMQRWHLAQNERNALTRIGSPQKCDFTTTHLCLHKNRHLLGDTPFVHKDCASRHRYTWLRQTLLGDPWRNVDSIRFLSFLRDKKHTQLITDFSLSSRYDHIDSLLQISCVHREREREKDVRSMEQAREFCSEMSASRRHLGPK